jgi:signal transduction histidine kinase
MGKEVVFAMPAIGLSPGALTNEVLAIVSHDLRAPLSTLSMGTSMLAEPCAPEEQARLLQVMKRAAQRMDRLIRDLQQLARLEAGHALRIDPEPLDVAPLLHEAREALRVEAEAKGQVLHCASCEGLPPVFADRDRLWQVLANLITNAIKFAPRGGCVTLEASADGGELRVTVRDTGPGIAPEDLPRLFEPFWQASGTARFGCGLGLKIAKAIVEAHGGRLWVDSASGQGAAFSFALPLAGPRPAAPGTASA